jgi:hypothetical protein
MSANAVDGGGGAIEPYASRSASMTRPSFELAFEFFDRGRQQHRFCEKLG